MKFDIITIFPEAFESYLHSSIVGRALKKRLIEVKTHYLRKWTTDRHQSVDDKPYGGGPGMVMKIEPIYKAVTYLKSKIKRQKSKLKTKNKRFSERIILLSAKGKLFTQQRAKQLSKYQRIIFICGHYEGVDERVAKYVADEELSIGQYVLTGGELAAMAVIDAVSRLVPGVLGRGESLAEESFSRPGLREYPHYTRPDIFRVKDAKGKMKELRVPKELLSGNHAEIALWRKKRMKGA